MVRRGWMVIGLLVPLALALALAACGSDGVGSGADGSGAGSEPSGDGGGAGSGSAPAVADLDGRTFASTTVTGRDLVADTQIRLSFDGEQLGVNAGCNQATGGYEVADGVLRWTGPAAMTQMACEDDRMAQDAWVADLLERGAEASLDGEVLVLVDGEVAIELADEAAAGAAPIVGTVWSLESTIADEAASSVPADVEAPTLEVADDGTAAVFAGCNRGSGPFVVADDGASATVGPLATTKMFCEGAASELEATVLGVLDGEVALTVAGDQLTVARDGRSLVYRAT